MARVPSAISSLAVGPDDAHAQDEARLRLGDDLDQAVGAAQGAGAAQGGQGEAADLDLDALLLGLALGQPGPGDLRVGEDHRGDGPVVEGAPRAPAMTSAATLPSRLALWASMGPWATSPMAKMVGSAVRHSWSVTMKPLVVDLRPWCSPGRCRRCWAGGRWPPAPGRSGARMVSPPCSMVTSKPPPLASAMVCTFESTMISCELGRDLLDHHVHQVLVGAHQQAREELHHRDLASPGPGRPGPSPGRCSRRRPPAGSRAPRCSFRASALDQTLWTMPSGRRFRELPVAMRPARSRCR